MEVGLKLTLLTRLLSPVSIEGEVNLNYTCPHSHTRIVIASSQGP